MASNDKIMTVLEKVSEISERTARIEAHMENLREDVGAIKQQDEVQNRLLDEHIRRTDLLEAEIKDQKKLEPRVEQLEKYTTIFNGLIKIVGFICGTAGSVYFIGHLLHRW